MTYQIAIQTHSGQMLEPLATRYTNENTAALAAKRIAREQRVFLARVWVEDAKTGAAVFCFPAKG